MTATSPLGPVIKPPREPQPEAIYSLLKVPESVQKTLAYVEATILNTTRGCLWFDSLDNSFHLYLSIEPDDRLACPALFNTSEVWIRTKNTSERLAARLAGFPLEVE